MDNFADNVLVHELGETANYSRRKIFYDDIVNISSNTKKKISLKLKEHISGCNFRGASGESIIGNSITDEMLKDFGKKGYLYPFNVSEKNLDPLFELIKGLKFQNTWRNSEILGKNFLDDNNLVTTSENFAGTYWLTEAQSSYTHLIGSKVMQDIAFDPKILDVVAQYLGCTPIHVASNIWFSSPTRDPEEQKKSAQMFHQDAGFVNFVKVFIYLNPTNKTNGAHAYIEGSHSSNPSEMIPNYVASKRYSDEELSNVYGQKKLKQIEGHKGDLIFADTSCFHKGGVVQQGARLMLNLEYASSLFGAGMNYFDTLAVSDKLDYYSDDIRTRMCKNYNPTASKNYLGFNYQLRRLKHKAIVLVKKLIGA